MKSYTIPKGVFLGSTKVPINAKVLEEMEKYGFKPEYVKHAVEANEHNHTVATYFLMCQKLNTASIHKRRSRLDNTFSSESNFKHTASSRFNKTFTSASPRP